MNQKITVLGGDTRQIYTAGRLAEAGFDVSVFGFELYDGEIKQRAAADLTEAAQSGVILLGLPCSANGKTLSAPFADREYGLKDISERIKPGTVVFAGMVPGAFASAVKAAGGEIRDYFTREELTVKNALLTGEGVLSILLDRLPVTVFGSAAAVIGYGRVAYYTARMLRLLGAEVTVFARDPAQLAKAQTAGMNAVPLNDLADEPRHFTCLINTVPAPILGAKELAAINRDCLLIEVASAPYGIDKSAAASLGHTLVKASSLPGKTAPVSAGRIIADTVIAMLREVTT